MCPETKCEFRTVICKDTKKYINTDIVLNLKMYQFHHGVFLCSECEKKERERLKIK